jgi:hypothetical protein
MAKLAQKARTERAAHRLRSEDPAHPSSRFEKVRHEQAIDCVRIDPDGRARVQSR